MSNRALLVLSNYEGFSYVLIETMANSTLLFFRFHLSQKENIQHSVNGLMFPVGNVNILANLISSNIVDYVFIKIYK